jgi:HSP20 family protein
MLRDLMTLQDRMNRLFEQSMPKLPADREDNLFAGSWAPAVDIYETENEIVLKADLPDIKAEEVDIRVEDNVLYLRGERKFEKETKEENFHRVERSYGSFARSFSLPHTVAADKIQATYKDGVLQLTMPKREESKPKQIKINVTQ